MRSILLVGLSPLVLLACSKEDPIAPTASILSPQDGETYYADQKILFEGLITDDAVSPNELSVVWKSDIDGELDWANEPDSKGKLLGYGYLIQSHSDRHRRPHWTRQPAAHHRSQQQRSKLRHHRASGGHRHQRGRCGHLGCRSRRRGCRPAGAEPQLGQRPRWRSRHEHRRPERPLEPRGGGPCCSEPTRSP